MNRSDSWNGPGLEIALLVVVASLFTIATAAHWRPVTTLPGRLLAIGVLLASVAHAVLAAGRSARRARRELRRRNRELRAMQQANLDIYGELSLEAVLQRVVDQAANLLGARYGALSVVGEDGRVEQFVTSGVDEDLRRKIGNPPAGKGLLGVSLHHGESLRLSDAASDPRAAGLPPHHPEIHSLLAVPVTAEHPFRANLYVAERADGGVFTTEDERTLTRFADQAALAIEKAVLHRQLSNLAVVKERARIAREMHDGMAQVLAYVNTKAQAVREYVVAGKTEKATRQLEQLAAAARDVLTEVREGILALRTDATGERSFQQVVDEYLGKWREQTGIAVEARIPAQLGIGPAVELQLLRIVQEALSNVRKHSGADRALLAIESSHDGLRALIEDRGVGFDEATLERKGGPRFGLAIMRERAESVGGTLVVDSAPGRGTSVRVDLPAA